MLSGSNGGIVEPGGSAGGADRVGAVRAAPAGARPADRGARRGGRGRGRSPGWRARWTRRSWRCRPVRTRRRRSPPRSPRTWAPTASALLPAWEALPYEGIGPTPEIAARRADAIHRLREATGAFVVVAPALAAMQGLIPTLGAIPPLELVAGRELAPDALADRLVDLGLRARRPGRASRRVRGPRRRGRRVPRRRATPGPPGVLGRGDRVAPRVLLVDAALHREGRARARARRCAS